jgi:putative cell wall-binding protein
MPLPSTPSVSRGRALLRPLLAALAVALAVALVPPAPGADAQTGDGVTAARVDGTTRVDTAAVIARLTFDEADVAVLSTAFDFPDALAGSFAAGRVAGPLLLVQREAVPEETAAVLEELGVRAVVLLGGSGAISDAVADDLRADGFDVQRVAGGNRYETAAAIARAFGQDRPDQRLGGQRVALLASGEAFPDALAAGPLAAAASVPLLLTPQGRSHPSVDEALEELGVDRVLVVGGTAAVSEAVAQHHRDGGYVVERVAGATRTATATAVADVALRRFTGFSTDLVLLARGDDFPDALAASAHGAALGAPVLLTATPDVLSSATSRWFEDACPEVDAVRAIGGVGAVSDAALRAAVDAAGACTGDPGDPEIVGAFTTPLPQGQPDRNHNIHLALDTIDGDVIRSGAGYSLDTAIGPRSAERGYRVVENGCIGSDGQPVDCRGGGISQVATTFVNAAWESGVHLEEFRPHTTYFERYPMCREATIVEGQLDVVVVNDTPYDLVVASDYTDEQVTVSFVSRPWFEVESWTGEPYDVEGPGGAFSVDCGRMVTGPDGGSEQESYTWRYSRGFPG